MIIAQGKRSAALGYGGKMISSFFPSGLARWRRAKPEGKKEIGWGGPLPRAAASAALPWASIRPPLRGSVSGGCGSALYIAQPNAVLKLKMDGTFTTIASSIELRDCDVDYPDHNPHNPKMPLPSLRGLAVDEDGTVFAAGVGCHAVVKMLPGLVQPIINCATAPSVSRSYYRSRLGRYSGYNSGRCS
jgi:hypothetical protein